MTREPTATKLFVGQVPRDWSEAQVKEIFSPYGEIHSMNLLYDKAYPGQHRGCAFITYYDEESAKAAQEELHERKYLPGMRKPMQVKPSEAEVSDENRKLFIGMLSRSATEASLKDMFAQFGAIEHINVLQEKGCAFIKYETRVQAANAIKAMHNSITMEGARNPLVVKLADSEKDKATKQQLQQHVQQQKQMTGPGALNPFAGIQQSALANGIATLAAQVAYYQQVFSQMGLPQVIAAAPGAPLAQTLAQTGQGSAGAPVGNNAFGLNSNSQPGVNSGKDGPEGANLFIYQVPIEFSDSDLFQTFAPFGNITNAKVYIDKETGLSKGFGFVSFDNVTSANSAISSMNGFVIGGRRLQVQVRNKKKDKPY